MDDLLVIILTLIIAGAGALGQLKKKKRAAVGSDANKNTSNSFWDLIQGESNLVPQEEVSEFEEADLDSETESYVKKQIRVPKLGYSFDGKKEGESEIEGDANKATRRSKLKSGELAGFSLRKAVVYSEILNRKYT